MANLITGLRYHTTQEELNTEEELFEIFSELTEAFKELEEEGFEILDKDENPIHQRSFLEIANTGVDYGRGGNYVILRGSGNVNGLRLENASLEYDLSKVAELTRYWNQRSSARENECFSCTNSYRTAVFHDESRLACKESAYPCSKDKPCPPYNAKIKNAEGGPARTLQEMISAASEELEVA